MDSKRIAFILYRYPLGISSMIINSIKLFIEKGCHVDIYINRDALESAPIDFEDDNVSFFVYDERRDLLAKALKYSTNKLAKLLSPLMRIFPPNFSFFVLFHDIFVFSQWLRKNVSRYDYSYLLPVECRSLLSVKWYKKKKIIYYNMELLDWSEKNPLYKNKLELKKMEYRMIQGLDHVAITSPLRAGHFSGINDFDIEKIRVLPVAPIGEPIHKRSSFFREKFGIPDNSKIVLYIGNFEPWFMCLEIIKTVKNWPQDFVLVMHTWNKSFLETQYYEEMVSYAKGMPVYFSSDYIEYDGLAEAISSADIGLMFYEAIDANFTEILFSSNKFGEYLRAGLPIICSEFASLKEFVEENGVGMAVPVNELSRALDQIKDKLDIVKKNAHLCYEEKIRFESHFDRFFDQLSIDV